jgi:hypothetical protein
VLSAHPISPVSLTIKIDRLQELKQKLINEADLSQIDALPTPKPQARPMTIVLAKAWSVYLFSLYINKKALFSQYKYLKSIISVLIVTSKARYFLWDKLCLTTTVYCSIIGGSTEIFFLLFAAN